MTVLLFIGSVGLWDRAHQLSPELGLMLGIAAAQYGFALALRRPVAGGAMLGVGIGIAFLVDGTAGTASGSSITALALPRALRDTGARGGYALGRGVALAVAIRARRRLAARALLSRADASCTPGGRRNRSAISRAARPSTRRAIPTFLLKNLPWFAWPALPLVLWTLSTRGPRLQRRARHARRAAARRCSRS